MEEPEPIINKVAESDIKVFNLEALWDGRDIVDLDLADWLYKKLVLKEKDFREKVREHDWSQYSGKHVAIACSTNAILPTWATMLVATRLEPVAASVAFGTRDDLVRDYFLKALSSVVWEAYTGAPVVIKGCASQIVPQSAYVTATLALQSVAAKLMFGEPCSSVPLWRRRPDTVGKQPTGAKSISLPPDFLKRT